MKIKRILGFLLLVSAAPLLGIKPSTTALFNAAKQGDVQALNSALAADANVKEQDSAGNTALVYAVTVNKNPEGVKLLVHAGSALTYTNKSRNTVDILTLAVDQAVNDYRYLDNLKELLQALHYVLNITQAISLIDVQLKRLTIKRNQLQNVPINKTTINNILNAMVALDDGKKELEKSAQMQAEMDAEDRVGYNWADLNR